MRNDSAYLVALLPLPSIHRPPPSPTLHSMEDSKSQFCPPLYRWDITINTKSLEDLVPRLSFCGVRVLKRGQGEPWQAFTSFFQRIPKCRICVVHAFASIWTLACSSSFPCISHVKVKARRREVVPFMEILISIQLL